MLNMARGGVLCSFQVLEHIGTVTGKEDVAVIKAIPEGVPFIFSVPNFNSADHKRFFTRMEWLVRYSKWLHFQESITYIHKKTATKDSRSYLFKTIRKKNKREI